MNDKGAGSLILSKSVTVRTVTKLSETKISVENMIERPPGVWEVIGSNPVGDSEVFFVPCS